MESNSTPPSPAVNGTPGLLTAFFNRIEKRPDGWYLSVSRDQKEVLDLPKIRQELLDARALNVDWARIEDVVNRGRGAPERIGAPFEYYDLSKDKYILVTVSDDRMNVAVTVSAEAAQAGVQIAAQDILYRLRGLGIICPVDEAAVAGLTKASTPNTPVNVAKGKPPRHGVNAQISFEVVVTPDNKPRERLDGRVDFKGIKTFRQVSENDVIATRLPPTSGEDGQDVYGKVVPCRKGEDAGLPAGENTTISEDGKKLIAACRGFLFERDGLICIGRVLTLEKDVDYSTGNIKYQGAVVIKGSVRTGFRVEADEDILIQGGVEAAEVVSRNGSIVVHSGVLGGDKARLIAKHDIEVGFAQQAFLETEGQLKASKHLLHCQARAESIFLCERGGVAAGGVLSASKRIEVYEAGIAKGLATILRVARFDLEKGDKKAKELEALEAKINIAREPVEKRLKLMNSMIRKTESLGEKAKLELKKVMDEYISLGKKLEYVQAKRAELASRQSGPITLDSEIIIRTGYPMVILDFCGRRTELKQVVHGQRFWLKDDEIKSGPATEGGGS